MRIGIDLGGTKTEGIVLNDQGEISYRIRKPTPQKEGYAAILDNIVSIVSELETESKTICRIGIGLPGSISLETGRLHNANTVCLNNQPVLDDLQTSLQRKVWLANDANCFALSEAIDGAAKGARVVFGIIIGTGTGGGIVVNQQLVNGVQSIAGEWGHNPLGVEKRPCYCGRNDCVETYLSGSGLITTWENAGGKDSITAEQIASMAKQYDHTVSLALEQYHQHFGRAVASVINILDPDVIVLGGGLSHIDSLYKQGVQAVRQHVFSDSFHTRIVKNAHGDSSGVRGAAWLCE